MLKIFRKIRQQLLNSGQMKKYSIYALGEIFLVVIGILIALQINNWNEENKTYQKQRSYLELIQTEMSNNLDILKKEKLRLNELIEGLREIIALKSVTSEQVNEKVLSKSWGKAFGKTIRYQYENGTLKELISSGGLKNIDNHEIRNALASMESKIQKIKAQEVQINDYMMKGNNYLEKNGSVRVIIDEEGGNAWWGIEKLKKKKSNQFLLKSQEFENIVVFSIGTGQALYDAYYIKLENEIVSLLAQIENELK